MADFVRCRSSQIEWRRGRSNGSEISIVDDNAVGCSGTARKLRIAQEATAHAEAIIRKAHEATELERQKMLSDVRHEVARLVVKTSSVVLDRDLSSDEKEQFSNSAASELAKSA